MATVVPGEAVEWLVCMGIYSMLWLYDLHDTMHHFSPSGFLFVEKKEKELLHSE